jgi:hypothetical protein
VDLQLCGVYVLMIRAVLGQKTATVELLLLYQESLVKCKEHMYPPLHG